MKIVSTFGSRLIDKIKEKPYEIVRVHHLDGSTAPAFRLTRRGSTNRLLVKGGDPKLDQWRVVEVADHEVVRIDSGGMISPSAGGEV